MAAVLIDLPTISVGTVVLVSGIAFFAGLILGFWIARRSFAGITRGEALVANAIYKGFTRPYVLLNNVTFEIKDGTTQIDHILVADTGIYVIETKDYSGWIFGRPNDSHWTQVIFKKKSRFQNPLVQNYGHLKTVQSLFNLPNESLIPVVFCGDAEFKTELGASVLRFGELLPYLSEDRPVLFDERKMAYVVGRIEMKRLRRSLETDEYHLNYLRRRHGD